MSHRSRGVGAFLQLLPACWFLLSSWPKEGSTKFALQSESNASHAFYVNKILCVEEPYKLTHLNYCQMGQFPNRTIFVNVSLDVPIQLNYLAVSVKLFYKYTTYHPFMVDWTIELCQAKRFPKRRTLVASVVLKVIAETVPQYFYSCPHGNRTYSTVWHMDSKYVLRSIPSGDYRLDIKFADRDSVTLFAIQVFGAVRKHGLVG